MHDSQSLTPANDSAQSAAEGEPVPVKKSKLFANYESSHLQSRTAQHTSSSIMQMNKYLEMEESNDADIDNCLSFWHRYRDTFNKLVHPAARALSVPASSSPVERVFSHGGIILRPHRARMSDTLLSKLIFLKCNNLFITQE